MNNFSDSNFIEMPTWVEDYNLEYKKHRNIIKNFIYAICFVIISAVILLIFLEVTTKQYYVIITIMLVVVTIIYVLKSMKYPFKPYEFLSSVIYETGFLLYKNDDPKPQIYAEKINTLLGNWYYFIGKIEKSIFGSYYVINIKSLCNKLRTLNVLLNEYTKKYDKYPTNKYDISTQLMELANSIYKEREDINKHIELTDSLITHLQNGGLQGEPINIPLYDSFNKILIMTPQYIKLTITAIFVLIFIFSIYIMGQWMGIETNTLFSTSVGAGVVIMLFVISKKK